MTVKITADNIESATLASLQGAVGPTGPQGAAGLGFAIAKSYASVAALTADTAPTGIIAGQFAIIETGDTNNAENSRLYLWSGTSYSYVSDLSGAVGINGATGPTGVAGVQGPTGPQGAQGTQGNPGIQGATGPTGAASTVVGPTGPQGPTGAEGAASTVAGPTGAQGAQGPTGPAGIGYAFNIATETFTGDGSTTAFTISSGYSLNNLLVVVNGILLKPTSDYTLTDTTLTFVTAPDNSSDIVVRELKGDGATGPTGSQGITGPTGAQGVAGPTGANGSGFVNLNITGAITTPYTGTARFYPPAAMTINTVYANLSAVPSGDVSFIIKKNGVSIGTTFTLSTALMTPVSVNIVLTTTDYLTVDVSGASASNLNIKLKYL